MESIIHEALGDIFHFNTGFFEVAASALLARKRLRVEHFNRDNGQTVKRDISPQRLVYYRDNWYLDSWCHLREDLRSFAVDAFRAVTALPDTAYEVEAAQITDRFDSGYGVFSHPSAPRSWATLRFSPWRARWVESEQWHPDQRIRKLHSGELELEVPYHDPRELIGDILRHGSSCQVVAPDALHETVTEEVQRMFSSYVRNRVAVPSSRQSSDNRPR